MENTDAAWAAKHAENRESNMRYIYAKLPCANPSELAWIAAFISGLAISGWHAVEHDRQLPQRS